MNGGERQSVGCDSVAMSYLSQHQEPAYTKAKYLGTVGGWTPKAEYLGTRGRWMQKLAVSGFVSPRTQVPDLMVYLGARQ